VKIVQYKVKISHRFAALKSCMEVWTGIRLGKVLERVFKLKP
jgi:hypothetical protein